MHIENTNEHFGIIAIIFHWLMAIILIGLVIIGLYMTSLPSGPQKLSLIGLHKEFGFLILMLVMLRIVWRLKNILPSHASLSSFERLAARLSHWIFYMLMFALPMTGWIFSSAAGYSTSFFGLFVIPPLIEPNPAIRTLFSEIHEWLAYGLIATFCLHVAAALKHHFINKDNILKRMLI